LFKAELIQRCGLWRSFEAVEYATLEWVDWFNTRRPLEPIGNIPPAQAEANFHAALETEAMAAQPGEISLRKPGAVHFGNTTATMIGQVAWEPTARRSAPDT